MWLWTLIGLNLISELQGYTNGNFPESCGTMLPQHSDRKPQESNPPYMVICQNGNRAGDPVTVTLKANDSEVFIGFMLQARIASLSGDGRPIGKFIALDRGNTNFLTCDGSPDSAVSQNHNRAKTSISVNWTAEGAEGNIIFRATVLKSFGVFWERVDYECDRHSPTPTPTISPTPTPTIPPIPYHCDKNEIFGLLMMCLEILVEGVAWTVAQCFSRSRFHKGLMIFCNVACAALSISSLVFFRTVDHYEVTLVGLVSVVIVIIFIEMVLLLLPLGPSHELKEIFGLAHQVCCIIHSVFTIAVMLVGVVICFCNWPLKVLIAYTVWIWLNKIWVTALNVRKLLQKTEKESSKENRHEPRGIKEHLCAVKIDVIVAIIFMIGNLIFTAAVIAGLFQCQGN